MTYIGFSTTNHLISRLIRYFDRGKASHVWVRTYSPLLGEYIVFEAAKEGFRIIPFKQFERSNIIIREKEVDASQQEIRNLFAMVGRPYDYWGMPKFILHWLLRQVVPQQLEWKVRPTPGVMNCAEAISRWKPDLFPGNPEWARPRRMLRQLGPA